MTNTVEKLESDRAALLEKLRVAADMRRGSITEVFRRCGKDNCRCADASDPGHGPYYAYTRKVGGKTKTVQLRAGPLLSKIEREVVAGREFRATCDRLLDVSEALCEARPVEAAADAPSVASQEAAKKKGSKPLSNRRSSPKSKR